MKGQLIRGKNNSVRSIFIDMKNAYRAIAFYTPQHKKRRSIMLYPPNFECPPVRPSVRQRFVSVL